MICVLPLFIFHWWRSVYFCGVDTMRLYKISRLLTCLTSCPLMSIDSVAFDDRYPKTSHIIKEVFFSFNLDDQKMWDTRSVFSNIALRCCGRLSLIFFSSPKIFFCTPSVLSSEHPLSPLFSPFISTRKESQIKLQNNFNCVGLKCIISGALK